MSLEEFAASPAWTIAGEDSKMYYKYALARVVGRLTSASLPVNIIANGSEQLVFMGLLHRLDLESRRENKFPSPFLARRQGVPRKESVPPDGRMGNGK